MSMPDDVTVVRHIASFERNTRTRQWRAYCTCGWRSDEAGRQIVQVAAATHDMWVPAPTVPQ